MQLNILYTNLLVHISTLSLTFTNLLQLWTVSFDRLPSLTIAWGCHGYENLYLTQNSSFDFTTFSFIDRVVTESGQVYQETYLGH